MTYEITAREVTDALEITVEGLLANIKAARDRALTAADVAGSPEQRNWAMGRYEALNYAQELIENAFDV